MAHRRVPRTAAAPHGALPPLHTVPPREGGAAALGETVAQALGRRARKQAAVPPAPPGRRAALSLGPSLLLAARKRAPWPTRKRAGAAWSQGPGRARLGPAAAEAWRRLRGWAQRAGWEASPVAPRQEALRARRRAPCPWGERWRVSATPHASPCLPPCKSRARLPPRGSHTPQRAAWRPRSLALGVDAEQGLPLSSRGAEGHPPDGVALGARLPGRLGPGGPPHPAPHLPRRRAQGQGSRDPCPALAPAQGSGLAALPAGWGRQRAQGAVQGDQPLALPAGRRGKVAAPPQARLGGLAGLLLGRVRPGFARRQGRTRARLQRQAAPTRRPRHATRQEAAARHRPRPEQAGRRARRRARRPARRPDVCSPTLRLPHGAVEARSWAWERRQQRASNQGPCGQTGLLTARRERRAHRLVVASRSPATGAARCRIRTRRRPGVGWPAEHGTESTRSVHARSGGLALRWMRRVVLRLQERPLALGVALLLERLRGMQAARVVEANGTAQRGLTPRRPEHEALFVALNFRPWAAPVGHTVLSL